MKILDIGGFSSSVIQLDKVCILFMTSSKKKQENEKQLCYTCYTKNGTMLFQINNAVMSMVELYFPSSEVSVIAEPGSYFVSTAFTLAVNIISRKLVARDWDDEGHGE